MTTTTNKFGYFINKGYGMANGLYNISKNGNLTHWFENHTYRRLKKLNKRDFISEVEEMFNNSFN